MNITRAFIGITGSIFFGLILYELSSMLLWGILIFFVTHALGSDFSILRSIYDTIGWNGIGIAVVLYLIRAKLRVEHHLKKYEDRILKKE